MGWKFYNAQGIQRVAGPSTHPVGAIIMHGGSTAPSGWLSCDGSDVLGSLYPDLVAEIGPTGPTCRHNSDGTSRGANPVNTPAGYIRLPNYSGHSPIGAGAAWTGTPGAGATYLISPTVTKTGARTHTLVTSELALHSHPNVLANVAHTTGITIDGNAVVFINVDVTTATEGSHTHSQINNVIGFNTGLPGASNGNPGGLYRYNTDIGGTTGAGSAHSHTWNATLLNSLQNLHGHGVTEPNSGTGHTHANTLTNNNQASGGGSHNNVGPVLPTLFIIKY